MDELYDAREITHQIRRTVVRGNSRKYYRRARPGRWYGGIATADCVGCNLKCVFCWSNKPRDNPDAIGQFYTPDEIYESLVRCAERSAYTVLRVSGNEPTVSREHILGLLRRVEGSEYRFILETNGILLDREFARLLKDFTRLSVRVSLKGSTGEEFSRLTGADPTGFDLQLEALRNLVTCGVTCHPAVMLSFSTERSFENLVSQLKKIHPRLASEVEKEYLILYPHVVERLRRVGLKPLVALSRNGLPRRLK